MLLWSALLPVFGLVLPGCEGEVPNPETLDTAQPAIVLSSGSAGQDAVAPEQPSPRPLPPANAETPTNNTVSPQFSVDNTQYMFDVSNHSREELLTVLKRADEIATTSSSELKQLNIALILHGSDVAWFSRQHYDKNKELIDLAAKLDALEVIDMKICQQSMQKHGIADEDIPAFIERVPYAPDEITRLQGSGYFTL